MIETETYCLGLIAEECGEAIQIIGKALRFGYLAKGGEHAPYFGQNAKKLLPKELGDILAAMRFAEEHSLLNMYEVEVYADQKFRKLMSPEALDANGNRLAPSTETQQYFDADGSISEYGAQFYR